MWIWGERIAFFAPVAGRKAQLFHLIFTQPGKVILIQPCRWTYFSSQVLISALTGHNPEFQSWVARVALSGGHERDRLPVPQQRRRHPDFRRGPRRHVLLRRPSVPVAAAAASLSGIHDEQTTVNWNNWIAMSTELKAIWTTVYWTNNLKVKCLLVKPPLKADGLVLPAIQPTVPKPVPQVWNRLLLLPATSARTGPGHPKWAHWKWWARSLPNCLILAQLFMLISLWLLCSQPSILQLRIHSASIQKFLEFEITFWCERFFKHLSAWFLKVSFHRTPTPMYPSTR